MCNPSAFFEYYINNKLENKAEEIISLCIVYIVYMMNREVKDVSCFHLFLFFSRDVDYFLNVKNIYK